MRADSTAPGAVELDSIRISVSWSGRESVDARLRDLSARGPTISLSVPAAKVPELRLGSIVAVTIKMADLDQLNNVMSIVRDQRVVGHERLLNVEIVDRLPAWEVMPRELFALFNRRRYVRVDTLREGPILVRVSWDEEQPPMTAHLANISASGCALLFALDSVPNVNSLLMLFHLPDSSHRYRLRGTIKTVTDVGDSTCCGMAFDDDHSHEFLAQQSRIAHFVEAFQRDQLVDITNRFRTLSMELQEK